MQTLYELDSLSHARRYQQWMFEAVEPFLGKRILELGSGIGNLSRWLPQRELLILSEVEGDYVDRLHREPAFQKDRVQIVRFNLDQPMSGQFAEFNLDTIVSFNVLEHVEDDRKSFQEQVELLRKSNAPGPKRIVVFVPALRVAFGALDREFRHFRRYHSADMDRIFREIDPTIRVQSRYFNLLSLVPWIIQGRIFHNTKIKSSQVAAFERVVPFWKPVDRLLTATLRFPVGQSLISVIEV